VPVLSQLCGAVAGRAITSGEAETYDGEQNKRTHSGQNLIEGEPSIVQSTALIVSWSGPKVE
jgi:hypothetical protein